MPNKKGNSKKSGFSLAPIVLSEPVKSTDGFTNLVENTAESAEAIRKKQMNKASAESSADAENNDAKKTNSDELKMENQTVSKRSLDEKRSEEPNENPVDSTENSAPEPKMTEAELLRLLDAESLDEIYELTDVLRASSLKLYAALMKIADERGRARAKNHELMSRAGIKGIATLYKQERWLMDLKLLEKKAKPGPHDGSSYVVYKLESLPLPAEIFEKFKKYLSDSN